ncbi:gliding motility protein GldM [Cytophagales bacterium WSM2-2]|nr:gliding motility protein GldM [Cytophagales bacterium WSM2-2]
MAGGNETPRQKMIGMMYLVLTALLALNVSSAILEKFAIVNTTLEDLVKEDLEKNAKKLVGIKEATSKEDKVTVAKEKAEKVRELTKTMVTYLADVKKRLATGSDGKALEGEELVLNTNNPEEVMLDTRKPEVGREYEKRLKSYVKDLNDIMQLRTPFAKLNKKAEDFAEFKNDAHQASKDFLQFSFEGTPAMAAIAIVSQMQTEILEYEGAALDSLNAIAEGVVYKVDQLVPMVQAESNSVVAGQTYEGNLFVAGAASGVVPEMFKDGGKLQLEEVEVLPGMKVKMGKVKFPASSSNFGPDGVAKMSYKVRINLPGRTPLEKNIDYKVIRPTAIFGSAAAATLYRDCGTEIQVSIPGLTDLSGLDLNVPTEQGKAFKLAPGKFAILPTRAQCNVNTILNGQSIGVQKFETQDVPMPIAKLLSGPNTIDISKGIPAGTPSIRIEPEIIDLIFAKNNLKDNKYFVSNLVLQINGGSPITIKSGTIPLAQYNLKKGDNITISQVQVQRPAYDGTTKQVNGSKMIVNCRIN